MTKESTKALVIVTVVLIFLGCATTYSVKATNTMEFCSKQCHEMQVYYTEMQFSTHAKDHDGKPISCAQCHIPNNSLFDMLAVKAYSGTKDVVIHNFGNPNNLDRLAMQPVARRFVSDENCLKCHEDLYKDASKKKDISELGKIAHDAYLGKNGQASSKCVGCHRNIAHLPEFDKRYSVNKDFAARIANKEKYQSE